MRVALVSPYSWTYPGGVTRHIEALAVELDRAGHDVKVLAPFDPDRRRTAWMHRGARPQVREVPEWLVPLGGTIGWPSNGAVSNLAGTPSGVATLRRELRAGDFDVVHVHEPVAPTIGWDALTSANAPLVGTFHCYSESVPPHKVAALLGARRKLNHLNVRVAVSEAAAWTGRRFYGGRYRVIPNGVVAARGRRAGAAPARARRAAADRVRRPGRRAQGPARAAARLRGAAPRGAGRADRDRLDRRGARAAAGRRRGRDRARPRRRRHEGARAALGRPAVRAVAGRRVLRDGPDRGVRGRHAGRRVRHRGLSRRGRARPRRPAGPARGRDRAGRDAARPGQRPAPGRRRWPRNAGESAERYTWPRIAAQLVSAYEDARVVPAARDGDRAGGGQDRPQARRRPGADPGAAAAVAGAGARRRPARAPRAAGAARRRRAGDGRRLLPGGPAHRAGADRGLAGALAARRGCCSAWR